MTQRPLVAFAWDGLPYYAAWQLRRVAQERDISVVGTPGLQTRDEIARVVDREVIWLEDHENANWQNLGLPIPEWFFVSGWSKPQFKLLTFEAHKAGACIVAMVDNRRMRNFRQVIGSLAFRMKFRRLFDYVLVPGITGKDLMRFFGVPEGRILCGLYGADSQVFPAGPPLSTRERDFLFVGRFVESKGIQTLIEGVSDLRKAGLTFSLAALGAGKLEGTLRAAGITVLPFGSAISVSQEMRRSKFLVLPSRSDNWGVVVHEAACSGCGLILSDGVGAASDLLNADNGMVFPHGNAKLLANAMDAALQMPTDRLIRCMNVSLQLAAHFGPDRFAAAVGDIISRRGSGVP